MRGSQHPFKILIYSVLVIEKFEFWICFVFRAQDFEFKVVHEKTTPQFYTRLTFNACLRTSPCLALRRSKPGLLWRYIKGLSKPPSRKKPSSSSKSTGRVGQVYMRSRRRSADHREVKRSLLAKTDFLATAHKNISQTMGFQSQRQPLSFR